MALNQKLYPQIIYPFLFLYLQTKTRLFKNIQKLTYIPKHKEVCDFALNLLYLSCSSLTKARQLEVHRYECRLQQEALVRKIKRKTKTDGNRGGGCLEQESKNLCSAPRLSGYQLCPEKALRMEDWKIWSLNVLSYCCKLQEDQHSVPLFQPGGP